MIPTHNRRDLLKLALHTALWQQDVNLEVIVVDDGSTDDTATVVAGVEDPRVRLIRHEESQGVSAARNRGIAEARGEWIAFLDDDDLWAPDKLSSQLEAARSGHAIWAYVGSVNITLGHRVVAGAPPLPPEQIVQQLHESNVVPGGCSGVMVARDVFERVGPFDPELSPLADWDLWLRLAAVRSPACVPRPLVAYRVHAHNLSLDARTMLKEFRIVAERYGGGNIALLYRYLGWWSLRVDRRRDALHFFLLGVLRRNQRYLPRDFAGDLAYLVRVTVTSLRMRSRVPAPGRSPRRRSAVTERDAWMAEGQGWVDALVARIDEGPLRRHSG